MSSEWIANQWKRSELGDKRLTKRAIKIGEACLKTPNGSLPKKFGGWRDTKAAYRFFDSDGVSHEALQKVHNENVLEMAAKSEQVVLFIQDGSELIYNSHKCTYGLGPTADAFGQGIMFHTCLAVAWTRGESEVFGVAKQTVWIRPEYSEEKINKAIECRDGWVTVL